MACSVLASIAQLLLKTGMNLGEGPVVGAQNFAITTGQVGFTDTIQMGVGANDAGSATFTHDGPPPIIPSKCQRALKGD